MTGIEWTDVTWNPVTGCDRISPGCDNCYALTMAARLKAMGQPKYQNDGDLRTSGPGFGVTCHRDELRRPMTWRTPRRVFVNSMSDLFHMDVPTSFICSVFDVMAIHHRHTFQVLTKRPQRMTQLASGPLNGSHGAYPLPNVWLGVSVDNDRYTFRVDHLRATPAAIRFVSYEPALGPVPSLDLTGIDWVIIGAESGRGARPMHPDWAREVVTKARSAGTAVFVKQLPGGFHAVKDIGQFPADLQIREYPA